MKFRVGDLQSLLAETHRARQRAATEREARLAKALDRLPEIEAVKKRQGKKPE